MFTVYNYFLKDSQVDEFLSAEKKNNKDYKNLGASQLPKLI